MQVSTALGVIFLLISGLGVRFPRGAQTGSEQCKRLRLRIMAEIRGLLRSSCRDAQPVFDLHKLDELSLPAASTALRHHLIGPVWRGRPSGKPQPSVVASRVRTGRWAGAEPLQKRLSGGSASSCALPLHPARCDWPRPFRRHIATRQGSSSRPAAAARHRGPRRPRAVVKIGDDVVVLRVIGDVEPSGWPGPALPTLSRRFWTGTRSCATTTSATNCASSGSPSTRPTPASAGRQSGRRASWACRWRRSSSATSSLERAVEELVSG
jgi:hypothetical protein